MMKIDKLYQRCLAALAVAATLLPHAASQAGNVLIDPGVRHTNGMPIASSEPRRASSVTWSCNPDKIGYCGGHYYRPCCDSLRPGRLWEAAVHGNYDPNGGCYQTYAGPAYPQRSAMQGVDGIEPPGMISLGKLPNDMSPMGGRLTVPGMMPAVPMSPHGP